MGIIVGSLAGQNWHRQIRRQGLGPKERFDLMIEKTVAGAREFGFKPMGLDFGLATLPSTDPSYLDEVKARLQENDLVPVVGVGSVACHYDVEVRDAAVKAFVSALEGAARLGAQVCTFGTQRNGRVTRVAQLELAIEQLKVVGKAAKSLGLKICQEDFDYWTSSELIKMSTGSGLDNVGINSDTGNWLILDEDPVEATRKVLPYTFHSHVRDYVLERGTYNGVAVGQGIVDFERLLPVLAQAGQNQTLVFSIEVDTDDRDEDEAFRESCRYVKGWLERNGLASGG